MSYLDSPLYQQMLARTLAQGQPQSQYPGQAIGNTLAQLLNVWQLKKSTEAGEKKEQDANQAMAGLLAPVNVQPNQMAGPMQAPTPTTGVENVSSTPQRAIDANADKRSQIAALLGTGAVTRDALAPRILQGLGLGEQKAPIRLGKDESLLDPSNYQVLAQGPRDPASGFTLSPGQQRFDAQGQPVASVAPEVDYNKPFLPSGQPNTAYQDFDLKARATGRPVTSVQVSADKSFRTTLGENNAKMLDAAKSSATGALQTIDAANQVFGAIDSPAGVQAGPGASALQFMNQIGGGDPNKINNTRNAIQGMARLALGARSALKGQGQISDYEGRLLQKAASGDIDSLTVGEMRIMATTADKLARQQIKQNSDLVEKARKVAPDAADMLDFYNVAEPPSYQKPHVGIDDLLKKYGVGR